MMRKLYSLLILTFISVGSLYAQDITARIPGLEQNREYMSLLRQERALIQRADSISNVVAGIRTAIRINGTEQLTATQRDSIVQILSAAEDGMLQVRNDKLELVDKINAIEQDYVLSGLGDIQGSATPDASNSIFNNSYFRQSLLEDDYTALMRVHATEQEVREKATNYTENYNRIKALYDKYLVATTEDDAGVIYEQLSELIAQGQDLEDDIAVGWSDIYDQKSYVYSYFLEKENRQDVLEITENMVQDMQLKKSEEVEQCMSEAMMDYCLQKSVILNYEIYVAKLLNLPHSIDSLLNEAKVHRKLDYHLPIIEVEQRSFVEYEAIRFNAKSPYTASNPIPECVVYDYGIVYRILLGSYKYKQNISIFKNLSPLYVEHHNNQYSYYAGGFKTKAEASAAVSVLKKKGFKNPQIVEWCDGSKVNLSALGEEGELRYRINISGADLSEKTSSIIRALSDDMQISKVGEQSYVVGSFDSKAVAMKSADAISQSDETLEVEVVAIEAE